MTTPADAVVIAIIADRPVTVPAGAVEGLTPEQIADCRAAALEGARHKLAEIRARNQT